MKILKLELQNFRGSRDVVSLNLELGRSLLLYGDNGTGKSSFADSIEWIAKDRIGELYGEEVKANEGILNELSEADAVCSVKLETSSGISGSKTLYKAGNSLRSKSDENLESLASTLQNENLLIRNSQLTKFILDTKGDRSKAIAGLVGLEELTRVKDVLTKAVNDIKKKIRLKDYETRIPAKKRVIGEKLKELNISSREQFYSFLNQILKPYGLEEINDDESYIKVMDALKQRVSEEALKRQITLEQSRLALREKRREIRNLKLDIGKFQSNLSGLRKEDKVLSQIRLSKLLKEAEDVLKEHESDDCPLCEQDSDREALIQRTKERIAALKAIQEQYEELEGDRQGIYEALQRIYGELKSTSKTLKLLKDEKLNLDGINTLLDDVIPLGKLLSKKLLEINPDELKCDSFELASPSVLLKTLSSELQQLSSGNNKELQDLITAIEVSEISLSEMEKMLAEQAILEKQQVTMEGIRKRFIDLQRVEMERFLEETSSLMNEYFKYMNPSDNIDNIKLVPTYSNNEEFNGVKIEYSFHGVAVDSPRKFLSESYLNCIGLCLFLSSVALNKTAKFFVLDDVVSSFDKKHRRRFGKLLLEKFNSYQMIVLTHESEWFNIFSKSVKGIGWRVHKTKWSPESGIQLDTPPITLAEEIDLKIQNHDESGLGNKIRIYAEGLLKDICFNLGAKLEYRPYEANDERMPAELYSGIKSHLKKRSKDISDEQVFTHISTSEVITNPASHDSSYNENLSDCSDVLQDFRELDALFRCSNCNKLVNFNNYNNGTQTIDCGCKTPKSIPWKN